MVLGCPWYSWAPGSAWVRPCIARSRPGDEDVSNIWRCYSNHVFIFVLYLTNRKWEATSHAISQFYATIRGMNIQQFCKGFMQSLWRVVSQQMPQGFQGQRLKPQDFAENVWQGALVTSEVKSDGEKTKWSASDTTTPYLLVNKAKLMMQTKGNNLRFYFDNDKI